MYKDFLLLQKIILSSFILTILRDQFIYVILVGLQSKLVTEGAFVRIAPAVSCVVDRPTVHNLFKALAGDQEGISLSLWLTYINEYLK